MRILFVSVNREMMPYPVAPLGLAYVAGATRAAGHDVRILDLCFSTDVPRAVRDNISAWRPDLIGISIRNIDNLTYPTSLSYLDEMRMAVEALRQHSPVPIVAGGPGFSLFPKPLLAFLGLEFGVVGAGEDALCALASGLAEGLEISHIPNLIQPADNGRKACAPPLSVHNGHPARDLLDNSQYITRGGMANLQTKRGCPFECVYCTYPQIESGRLRVRPPKDVGDELASMLQDDNLNEVFFVDDIFNWPHDHAFGVCEEITSRRLRLAWTCFATPLGMTPELAWAMKRAGCRGVEFGIDTAAPSILRSLNKPFGQADIRGAADACKQAELPAAYYVVFGGPGETATTVAETCATLDELAPQAVLAFIGLRVYPGTGLHRISLAAGIVSESDDLLRPRFYLSPRLSPDDLVAQVASHAKRRANWVVPALGIHSDPTLLSTLRRRGHRGPLWDLLRSQ